MNLELEDTVTLTQANIDQAMSDLDIDEPELEGLEALDADLAADPTLVNSSNFLDAFEFECLAELGHLPRFAWYRRARAAQRAAARKVLTDRLDRVRKYKSERAIKPFVYSDMDLDEDYTDPVVSPVSIFHPKPGDGLMLDEILEQMTGFDTVVEAKVEPQFHPETGEELVVPERELRRCRQVIENSRAKAAATEICAFQWDQTWADKDASRYGRGRIDQGPLLTHAGETWNVCTAKSYPAVWNRELGRFVFDATKPVRYTVFIRTHLGTETRERNGKRFTSWTWEYHRFQHFSTRAEATEFQRVLVNAFRNEANLQQDTWQFVPGEASPWDPAMLVDHTGGIESSRELAE